MTPPAVIIGTKGINNHDAFFVYMPGTHFTTGWMGGSCLLEAKTGLKQQTLRSLVVCSMNWYVTTKMMVFMLQAILLVEHRHIGNAYFIGSSPDKLVTWFQTSTMLSEPVTRYLSWYTVWRLTSVKATSRQTSHSSSSDLSGTTS